MQSWFLIALMALKEIVAVLLVYLSEQPQPQQ